MQDPSYIENDFLKKISYIKYSREDLANIFFTYGEERKSRVIANLIVREREKELFKSTYQLIKIIEKVVHPKFKIKSFSRIFQALRIEVNKELESLPPLFNEFNESSKTNFRLSNSNFHAGLL